MTRQVVKHNSDPKQPKVCFRQGGEVGVKRRSGNRMAKVCFRQGQTGRRSTKKALDGQKCASGVAGWEPKGEGRRHARGGDEKR